MRQLNILLCVCSAAILLAFLPLARAQDWFVPGGQSQSKPQTTPRAGTPTGAPGSAPVSRGGPRQLLQQPLPPPGSEAYSQGGQPAFGQPGPQEQRPQIQVQLPPQPELPSIPKGSSPPASVMGVLSVQDVMRQSTAAQQMQKVLGERSKKLNEDAQREQASWRDMQQQLANGRAGMNAEQIRAKESELQERVTAAQRKFRERDQIIKEAAQYGLLQVERVLEAVIQQVSSARNMNLVLHREQVMLNFPEFDLTEQVTGELNKVLPSVQIPPDGMSSVAFAAQLAKDQPTKAAQATPAPVPGASQSAAPPAPAVATPAAPAAPAAPAPAAKH